MAVKDKRKMVTCAGAIVFRMGSHGVLEFLLVKPSKGDGDRWGVAKGHQEGGESVEMCAIREVYEETGVVCRLVYELKPSFTKNSREIKTVHLWLAKQMNIGVDPIPQQEEVSEVAWFPIDSLPPTHKYQQSAIKCAVEAIKRNCSMSTF